MQNKFKLLITLFLIIGIVVLGVYIYIQISKTGIETVITSVEEIKSKETKKNEVLITEIDNLVVVESNKNEVDKDAEEVVSEVEVSDKLQENANEKPSIIIEKPVINEDSNKNTAPLQSSIMLEPGTIIEELETIQIEDMKNEKSNEYEKKLKEKREREYRNQGRNLAGLEVSFFVDLEGKLLDTSSILSKGVVVIPWYPNVEKSVRYMEVLNKLAIEYGDKLNMIFLISGFEDRVKVENILKENSFSFKCYFDSSIAFLSTVDVTTNTEILFINEDDYIVNRLTKIESEEVLKGYIEKFLNKDY